MIKTIPISRDGPAHIQVDGDFDSLNFHALMNHSGGQLTTRKGLVTVDNQTFAAGLPVAVVLPVGKWNYEQSTDGQKYTSVTHLVSVDTQYGPSQHVNFILDGATFPQTWSRFTKL